MIDLNSAIPWIALAVSVASACFACAAWWTSREKLRLDLYNRRFEIFRAAVDFSNVLSAWAESDEHMAKQLLFERAVIESQFLFSGESGIFEILSGIRRKSVKKFAADQLLVREDRACFPDKCVQAADESIEALNWILFQAIPQLTEKTKPFLNFHTLTVWPGIE
jgi:hypothetical protein